MIHAESLSPNKLESSLHGGATGGMHCRLVRGGETKLKSLELYQDILEYGAIVPVQ